MRLSVLAQSPATGSDPEIAGLTADSRAVKRGYLFAALPGAKADGAAFVGDAAAKGAVAVLGGEALRAGPENILKIIDTNPRQRLAQMAARFYQRQPKTIVAVTGTNGKTSVASFVRQIWTTLGLKAASFGTVGVIAPSGTKALNLTTPDPIEIHRLLAELAGEGVDHVAFEASSIGLQQHRTDGVVMQAAGFTNLTRDHLDYHGTFEAYEQAKLRLFAEVLPPGAAAVINADSPSREAFARIAAARRQRLILVGEVSDAHLRIAARAPSADGQQLSIVWEGRHFDVALPLAGAFQASNAAVAAGLVLSLGADAASVFAALARLQGAPGRLEKIGTAASGVPVYVDYAHTPDALETVLQALRPHTAGRLWVVFGCGGDRDAGKRPLMGAAAIAHADRVIVTDDNPRTENAAAIRAAVLKGALGAHEIDDRALAIETAVLSAEEGDVVVIAGKGHETGQIVGREVRHFNDAEEARAAIAASKGGAR
ncbi:MAG: UDP-N-acetylmuramoyl-L-alanyl-D-glutamate--2,6-diaminopimelate ligase [Alphaproteobacteria bacterium]|nr:UDP-N-acetylmuramoyl-L-alanyl-D-glutamate--2,6-diaminopimelate ligase [Alphaproteobacteria bacterium]